MRERVRATDIVARLSGDEFAILMPQTDVEGAMHLGEDLRTQVADSVQPTSDADPVTISVGITMFGSEQAGGPEAVLVAADQAMYRAKEAAATRSPSFADPGESRRRGGARGRRRRGSATPSPTIASASTPSRSAALPPAASSATSCCCG
jgi:GGDEF domain-containing protein